MGHRSAPFAPGPEQEHRADHRHNEARRVKGGAGRRFGKHASNQAADDRAGDAEDRRHDKSKVLDTGQNRARTQADNETDDDRPNDV